MNYILSNQKGARNILMKLGVVDVGGGLRGVYAAGVFDYCLDHDIHFDLCVGVSAGSANSASYLAGQKGRNYIFYTRYAFYRDYMSLRNVARKHVYLDLDYIYGTLSRQDGENPLDYAAVMANPAEFIVVASNAWTGETKYFTKTNLAQDQYDIFKASSAIPFVCKPYSIDGIPYYDGALSDPVPIEKAFTLGCDKVVLLLSRPASEPRQPGRDPFLASRIQRKYPVAADNLRVRARRYNEGVAAARRYEEQGKALIIAPDNLCGMRTLSKDKAAMRRLYVKGYQDATAIRTFL